MKKIPTIKAVMSPFPHCIGIDASVRRAEMMMAEHGIRHLPVVEDGRLVSVVTDLDLRAVLDRLRTDKAAEKMRIGDVCQSGADIVDHSTPLDKVLKMMANSRFDSVLVVKEERLVGIFTKTDACLHFREFLHSVYPESGTDDAA